jgi:hypothetical protein
MKFITEGNLYLETLDRIFQLVFVWKKFPIEFRSQFRTKKNVFRQTRTTSRSGF